LQRDAHGDEMAYDSTMGTIKDDTTAEAFTVTVPNVRTVKTEAFTVTVPNVRVKEPPLPEKAYAEYEVFCNGKTAWKRWSACAVFGRKIKAEALPTFPYSATDLWTDLLSTDLASKVVSSPHRTNLGPAFLEQRRALLETYFQACASISPETLSTWLDDESQIPAPPALARVLSSALPMMPTIAQLDVTAAVEEAAAAVAYEVTAEKAAVKKSKSSGRYGRVLIFLLVAMVFSYAGLIACPPAGLDAASSYLPAPLAAKLHLSTVVVADEGEMTASSSVIVADGTAATKHAPAVAKIARRSAYIAAAAAVASHRLLLPAAATMALDAAGATAVRMTGATIARAATGAALGATAAATTTVRIAAPHASAASASLRSVPEVASTVVGTVVKLWHQSTARAVATGVAVTTGKLWHQSVALVVSSAARVKPAMQTAATQLVAWGVASSTELKAASRIAFDRITHILVQLWAQLALSLSIGMTQARASAAAALTQLTKA